MSQDTEFAKTMTNRIRNIPELTDILRDNPGWLDEAIDTAAVSQLTGIPSCTLTTWRCRGGGPRFMKLGTSVRYRRRTVLKWMADREASPPGKSDEDTG